MLDRAALEFLRFGHQLPDGPQRLPLAFRLRHRGVGHQPPRHGLFQDGLKTARQRDQPARSAHTTGKIPPGDC